MVPGNLPSQLEILSAGQLLLATASCYLCLQMIRPVRLTMVVWGGLALKFALPIRTQLVNACRVSVSVGPYFD